MVEVGISLCLVLGVILWLRLGVSLRLVLGYLVMV